MHINTSLYCPVSPANISDEALVCGNPTGGGRPPIDVLNVSTTISSDQLVDRIIKVPNNVTLTITGSELALSENSKIIVQPGGKLVITDSYLHGCGSSKWGGIEVNGNNNTPDQLIITGSAFANADYVIKTDKTLGILIDNNIFVNGIIALSLDKNKDFTITKNTFYNYDIGIKTKNTFIADVRSLIKENLFVGVKTPVSFNNDNHTKLDINCNQFQNYTQYAILSSNTLLKNQGSLMEGTGNIFISASILPNNKLNHNGNNPKYYYDPSNPITSGMNVIIISATGDGCLNNHRPFMPETETPTEKIGIISIAPNPATDETMLSYYLGDETSEGTVVITNIFGQALSKITVSGKETKINIDCSKFADGIYFISLIGEGNIIEAKKMIIAK